VTNGSRVVFTDTSFSNDPTNYSVESWLWDFGDGSQTNERNPAHWFYSSGNHTVTLTIENYITHTTDYYSVVIYFAPVVAPSTVLDIINGFDWGGFFIPMVFLVIIIMLFIVLFELIKKSSGRRKG
jgi:hypothetical protein